MSDRREAIRQRFMAQWSGDVWITRAAAFLPDAQVVLAEAAADACAGVQLELDAALLENGRLKATNERLERLVKQRVPSLDQIRRVEVLLRDWLRNSSTAVREAHRIAATLLPADDSDLPGLTELRGIMREVDHD